MNKGMDLFIGTGRFLLCGVRKGGYTLDLGATPSEFAQQFSAFTRQNKEKKQCPVTIYMGDDLLFFTRLTLPKQTPDVEKAIALQLDMLSPFGEDCLYAREVEHGKETIDVSLYLADRRLILPVLETLTGLGWRITGLYPESQRGLNKENRKKTWGLLSSGLFHKLTIFKAGHVRDRLQLSGEFDLQTIKKTYDLEEVQDIADIVSFPSPPVSGLCFNILPGSFRRTDYSKWLLYGLVGLNCIFALAWLSMTFLSLQTRITAVETRLQALTPQLQEVKKLKKQEGRQAEILKGYASIGTNKDLLLLLDTLTRELPRSSYLDQLRLDKKTGAIHLQGYTTDLGILTESLQEIGNATLESTLKRKGQTYFQIEVLPK